MPTLSVPSETTENREPSERGPDKRIHACFIEVYSRRDSQFGTGVTGPPTFFSKSVDHY